MIKINLLRSMGLDSAPAMGGGGALSAEMQKAAVLKIVMMGVFPGMLYVWETINIGNLNQRVAALQSEIKSVEGKKSSYGETAPLVEKYTKEKQKIEKQSDVIRGIMRNRLREVKALDSLQTITPSQVWFSKIDIKGSLVEAAGYSNTDEGLATLYTALGNSQFFSRFEPKQQGVASQGGTQVKSFSIEFNIGRQEPEAEPSK